MILSLRVSRDENGNRMRESNLSGNQVRQSHRACAHGLDHFLSLLTPTRAICVQRQSCDTKRSLMWGCSIALAQASIKGKITHRCSIVQQNGLRVAALHNTTETIPYASKHQIYTHVEIFQRATSERGLRIARYDFRIVQNISRNQETL